MQKQILRQNEICDLCDGAVLKTRNREVKMHLRTGNKRVNLVEREISIVACSLFYRTWRSFRYIRGFPTCGTRTTSGTRVNSIFHKNLDSQLSSLRIGLFLKEINFLVVCYTYNIVAL